MAASVAGTVVVTGATGALGRRVCALAAADPGVGEVVAIDRPGTTGDAVAGPAGPKERFVAVALDDPEAKRLCDGAAALVLLGATDDGGLAVDGTGTVAGAQTGVRALLADADVPTVVVLSSAMVYGAWANNPVPLTEDAPLRPDPELAFAIEKAELERLATEWGEGHPGATVAVVRPTVTVCPEHAGWLLRSPWSTSGFRVEDAEPPAQFLHVDDLAAAIDLARRARLDGAFNVAPDGWIPAEALRALQGPAPRVRLPAPVAARVAAVRWRLGLTGTPPGVLAYTIHPWVVASDRLRAAGWEPSNTNEEAFVASDRGGPFASMNARRRQLLALGAVVGGVAAVVTAAVVVVRRRRRD